MAFKLPNGTIISDDEAKNYVVTEDGRVVLRENFASGTMDYPQKEDLKIPIEKGFINQLFGLNGVERYQLWPEKMVRSAITLPGDVLAGTVPIETTAAIPTAIEPYSQDVVSEPNRFGFGGGSRPNPEGAIARVQDTAGMAGGATLAVKPGTASVGSGMLNKFKIEKTKGVNDEPIYTVKDGDKYVGEARLSHTGEYVVDLGIQPEYRRKGIASELYDHIEKDLGTKLKPSPVYQTDAGKAFWEARNNNLKLTPVEGNPFVTDVYHGTPKPGFEKFQKPEAGQYMPDRALGVHVAKDPEISNTFAKDSGGVYPLKIKDDSKFFEIQQDLLPYIEDKNTPKGPRNVISDQNAIEKAIYKTAYSKDPDMFQRFLEQRWNMKPDEAKKAATAILNNEPYQNGLIGRPDRLIKGLDDYIEYDGVVKSLNEADRAKAIEIFKKDLQDKGYEGIKYINTSPMETANAKDPTSYVVFDPSKSIKSKFTGTLMSDTGKPGAPLSALAKQNWQVKGFEDAKWYHGTTHVFDKFSLAKGNPENHLGKYPHFTTSPEDAAANYAGHGPDLTGRIERRAEEIVNTKHDDLRYGTEEYNNAYLDARKQATKELAGPHEGAIIPARMKMDNPVSLLDSKPTWLDFNPKYDKNGELVKEAPLTMKLLKSFKKQGEKYGFDGQKAFNEVAEKAALYDGGDVKASTLNKAMREAESLIYAEGPKGELISSHVISNIFKDLGFDGIVMDAKSAFPNMKNIPEGTLHAVPLKRNTVRGEYSGDILYSDSSKPGAALSALAKQNAPTFYSGVERAVSNAKLEKGDANQWLGYLRNQPGVRQEELEFVLNDLPKGQITKSQMEDIVKANKVELKETVLGVPPKITFEEAQELIKQGKKVFGTKKGEDNPNEAFSIVNDKGEILPYTIKHKDKFDFRIGDVDDYLNRRLGTQYEQYQLPGGENYREMLFRHDTPAVNPEVFAKQFYNDWVKKGGDIEWEALPKVEQQKWIDAAQEQYNVMRRGGNNFNSSHFGDHGTNLLAHMRMNDRNIEIPFTPEEIAILQKYQDAEPYLAKLRQSQAEVGQAISRMAKPLNDAAKDKILADLKAKKITNAEATKKLESGFDHPELKPLQNKLAKLRQEEDNVRAALPPKPEQKFYKTLHIEEIQSDWHQKGRDSGYKGEKEKLAPKFEAIEEKILASGDESIMSNPNLDDALKMAVEKKIITAAEAKDYSRFVKIENEPNPVPNAPLKDTWEDYALKRAIREAAEKGYDAISWTPGEAQALRYQNEIRQKLKTIEWEPRPKHLKKFHSDNLDDVKHIKVDGEAGQIWFNVDKNGNVVSASQKDIVGKKLSDVLGKDMAVNIMKDEKGNIDAKGYVMGAEGMKAAYDVRMVNKMNALVKKYGGKVEQNKIPENSGQPVHFLKLTPELKRKAMEEGFPLFTGSPIMVPVDGNPFEDKKKKPLKITVNPVNYDPFQ
jgi:ribosomal protein S18 acetylase RimI-like enzyme